MGVPFFVSDLHFGHRGILRFGVRNHVDADEHSRFLVDAINARVNVKDPLYILGDVAWTDADLKWVKEIKSKQIHLLLGNHDVNLSMCAMMDAFTSVLPSGIKKYSMWLSHFPIHPAELRGKVNVHGHIHAEDAALDPEFYFPLAPEFHLYKGKAWPVSLDEIRSHFSKEVL